MGDGGAEEAAGLSRRTLLRAAAAAGVAAPLLTACATSARGSRGSTDVTGSFDWNGATGTTIRVLQTPHPYQRTFAPLLKDFTALTGITVRTDLVNETDYFTGLTTDLAGGTGLYDVFMLGVDHLWQYGPPGWLEDLDPWIKNSAATADDYDVDDIFPSLRAATRWDFRPGSQIGTGGQYAVPWGFEPTLLCYNTAIFRRRGIMPPATFGEMTDIAGHLTDRSRHRYGIGFPGDVSSASLRSAFMTMYTRDGNRDYTVANGALDAVMNTARAVDFQRKWVNLARTAGPASWTHQTSAECSRDLGDGTAAMVWDAGGVSYPVNASGASRESGHLAWAPGPRGPDGSIASNLSTWSLGMSATSRHKRASWLFIQWATGKKALTDAVRTGRFADPARASVFHGPFTRALGRYPGYRDAVEQVIPATKVFQTPQRMSPETGTDWSQALQRIYRGADAQGTLDALATASTRKVNG